jgi:hypothetical protein
MNAAVATAYGYAGKASQAGSRGTAQDPPAPVDRVVPPFAGQGAVSA